MMRLKKKSWKMRVIFKNHILNSWISFKSRMMENALNEFLDHATFSTFIRLMEVAVLEHTLEHITKLTLYISQITSNFRLNVFHWKCLPSSNILLFFAYRNHTTLYNHIFITIILFEHCSKFYYTRSEANNKQKPHSILTAIDSANIWRASISEAISSHMKVVNRFFHQKIEDLEHLS